MTEEIENWLKSRSLRLVERKDGFHTTCGISSGTYIIQDNDTKELFEFSWSRDFDEIGKLVTKFQFPIKLEYNYEI